MNIRDIENTAKKLVCDRIADNQVVAMEWAVHEIVTSYGHISGDGAEFYRACARDSVYRIVKRTVDKYAEKARETDQLTLSGFEYLQSAYTVERGDERVLVPLERLTDQELLSRADEYVTQSESLIEHAKELQLYVQKRQAAM